MARFEVTPKVWIRVGFGRWGDGLDPVSVRNSKKRPNQETGLENTGHLKVLNDTKLVLMSFSGPP